MHPLLLGLAFAVDFVAGLFQQLLEGTPRDVRRLKPAATRTGLFVGAVFAEAV